MLGNGWPFSLIIKNPKQRLFNDNQLKQIQDEINQSKDIQIINFTQTNEIKNENKEAEINKRKIYRGQLNITLTKEDKEILNNLKEFEISQRTPIRVSHRRAIKERLKNIFNVKVIENDVFIETSAGTYVKEFVHGDLGRTTPSMKDILNKETELIELDVIWISQDNNSFNKAIEIYYN